MTPTGDKEIVPSQNTEALPETDDRSLGLHLSADVLQMPPRFAVDVQSQHGLQVGLDHALHAADLCIVKQRLRVDLSPLPVSLQGLKDGVGPIRLRCLKQSASVFSRQ